MSYSTGTIKIPVLFDMSGDTIVYGEEVSGDFVSSHLDFLLDMTTEANDISLNAADISSAILVGDQDSADNIFYSGGSSGNIAVDNLCNRIAKAITRGKLVHVPKSGDHSNSGIPMGGRANLTNNLGELGSDYAIKYLTSVAPIGDEQMLGQAMARVASIHLVGSPLAAGIFEDQNQIQTDLETASAQTFNSGNTAFYNALAVQLSKVLGGSKSSAPMNSGISASIPGGDLASQNFSINFDSLTVGDSYSGGGGSGSSTAQVVDGTNASHPNPRVSGSLYLRTATNQYNAAKIYYDSTTTRAISFWHHFTLNPPPHADAGQRSLLGGIYAGDTLKCSVERRGRGVERQYIGKFTAGEANVQWWVDGVKQSYVEPGSPGQWYFDASDNGWHHHYIDLGPGYTANDITQVRMGSHKTIDNHWQYQNFGFFDDFRFFDERLTDAQIIDLAAGNNGNPGGGTIVRQPLDASGTSVPALKSIYEQLMNVPGRSQIMETRDVSGVVDNSNVTLAGGFPFISGDKLVMYLRPKIVFATQTKAQQSTTLVGFSEGVTLNEPAFNVGRDGQGITGQTYSQSTQYTGAYGASEAFEGTVTGGYGWLSGGHFDNTTGAYNRNPPTNTSVDGANVAGAWAQVNVGKNVAVTSYKIYPQNWETHSIGGRSPHIFKLVYSDDGTNFLTADSQTVGTDSNDTSQWVNNNVYIPKTFTLTNTKIGQYWRLIVSSVYGNSTSNGGFVSIQELEIMGSDDYSGSGDSGGIDLSGIQTNIVATAENIENAFPGNANAGNNPEINKWGWMGSATSDSLSLETTDVTNVRTCDLHIWKITITL